MDIKRNVTIKNEDDTRAFGVALGKAAKAGQVIGLIGDLGTGKTTLSRYIGEGMGVTETINSPTFTIVKEYESGRLPLYHFDVYRISDPEEFFNIGAEDYFNGNGVCIVEWADLVKSEMPEDTLYIFIEYGEKEGERIYRCTF
jgi:tRNA threonylcarbamoyladenosine biosynthesis protein TsaE